MENGKFIGRSVSAPVWNFKLEKSILKAIIRLTENMYISGFVFFCFRVNELKSFKLYEINPGLCGDKIADELLPKLWPNYSFFEADVHLCVGNLPKFPEKTLFTEGENIEV